MRSELIEEMLKDVYGPRGGVEEEIEGDPVREYITGVIISKYCKKTVENPDSEITSSIGENRAADDDETEEELMAFTPSELNPKERPKSFGISFIVRGEAPSFDICVTWGRYIRMEDGDSKKWIRKPYYHIIKNIHLDSEIKTFSIYDEEDGKIELHMRKIPQNSSDSTILITLVNALRVYGEKCYEEPLTESSIFQPSIRIRLGDGTELTSAYQNYKADKRSVFEFLYRKKPALARGFMCSAIWKEIDYSGHFNAHTLWPDGQYFVECSEFVSPDIRTEFVPLYPTPSPLLEWEELSSEESPELSVYKLSEMWHEERVEEYLSPLLRAYRGWIERNEDELSEFNGTERNTASNLIELQKVLLGRMEAGVELLKNDREARLSFCFASRSLWLQKKWELEKKGREVSDSEILKWRPFQLAFILMGIESIASKNSDYRDYVDLLWIPTGGGKTEAYLGLMAFTMAFRRLKARGNDTGDITGGGTAVITRYTLRILTIQQFRRTLRMVTAAEYLRVMRTEKGTGWRPIDCEIEGDWIYGSTRFSAGMWVGGAVSPNHLRKDGGAIDALTGKKDRYGKKVADGEPAQVLRCPVCDSWLAVPKSGLPAGKNTLHLVVKSPGRPADIQNEIMAHIDEIDYLKEVKFSNERHSPEYMTLTVSLEAGKKLTAGDIEDIWHKITDLTPVEIASFTASRPGYFGIGKEPGKRKNKNDPIDFEIYCPNPSCGLNNDITYTEGVPLSPDDGDDEKFPDGYAHRKVETPFLSGSRMPVPAYTVDEQIYHRCPTIIIATADKIARLAFEPRAASIFGNVSGYNAFYGYYRNGLFPEKGTTEAKRDAFNLELKPFSPPDLIVQDELHLINGPLGSMYGLYENIVDGLMKTAGGKPKYIAATATIKEADYQVRQLFARKLFQFPPHGLDLDNTFFVKYPDWDESWDEEKKGRIYMGIYSPGMGPHTPVIRIWSRLLKTSYDLRSDADVKYFWTIVGYFNAIRELGGGIALYREDIVEWLKHISEGNTRMLEPDGVVELSSRINSTDIPQILDDLEKGGQRQFDENPDAIFTTSMFGTGVDIPHLSLMVVNGQPKTTSQYIQATGRVGRTHGGLVITFLRAGRPRDLSHYEMFPAYHHRIHMDVEPSAVSPYSDGCLARASGPSMVSFLRNMQNPSVKWYEKDGTVILNSGSETDINTFKETVLLPRLNFIAEDQADAKIRDFEGVINAWENMAYSVNDEIVFVEYSQFRKPEKNVVLGDPQHEKAGLKVVYKDAPQSLREVEETTGFEV